MPQNQIYATHLASGKGHEDIRSGDHRNYHIFHYVLSGEGYIQLEDRRFFVTAGQTFYFPPDTRISYWSARGNNSWEYLWVNFTGRQAEQLLEQTAFSVDNPVCSSADTPAVLYRSMAGCEDTPAGICLANGLLVQLLAFYINCFPSEALLRTTYTARPILAYIRNNLYRPELNVEYIARAMGISRVTLYRRFMEETGTSPTKYIRRRRLVRAAQMLTSSRLPVNQIAYAVGYSDPLYFSKEFRRYFGKTPTQYRNNPPEGDE